MAQTLMNIDTMEKTKIRDLSNQSLLRHYFHYNEHAQSMLIGASIEEASLILPEYEMLNITVRNIALEIKRRQDFGKMEVMI